MDYVLIEKASSGISLLQQLRSEDRRGRYRPIVPMVDKEMRMEAETARLETGAYLLPVAAPWLEDFRRDLMAFPKGRYDDQVDALSQFLSWSGGSHCRLMQERDPVEGRPLGHIPPIGRLGRLP